MEDEKPSARADLAAGVVWLTLALAIVAGAWRMDRLEHLQASIYTAPGLVPGMLGAAIALMAAVLIVRAVRSGALADAAPPRVAVRDHWRFLTALALCLVFAVGMVGRGIVFWLAAAVFVAIAVFVFQYAERRAGGTLARGALVAAGFGLAVGLVIHYAFQDVFLVRLP